MPLASMSTAACGTLQQVVAASFRRQRVRERPESEQEGRAKQCLQAMSDAAQSVRRQALTAFLEKPWASKPYPIVPRTPHPNGNGTLVDWIWIGQ